MKSKIKYTNEPMGELRVVRDFLPSPDELAFREEKVKVTISLSRASLDFFKHEADKRHTPYQKMIRNLLNAYAIQHDQEPAKPAAVRETRNRYRVRKS